VSGGAWNFLLKTDSMSRSLALALALLASLPLTPSSHAAEPPAPPARKFEFETFQLILLVRAPTWKQLPDAEAEALQAQHLAHLTKMAEAGKAVVCGPFGDQKDVAFRGACIYRVASADEARALAEQDPTVKAGQLRIEAVTWYVQKGVMTFPAAPARAP
jgi:uncharacterized protein YciI